VGSLEFLFKVWDWGHEPIHLLKGVMKDILKSLVFLILQDHFWVQGEEHTQPRWISKSFVCE
jgi:hypothetical protein